MKISIVTPDFLASTPRVVKEADALSQAGHQVRVIFSEGPLEYLRQCDEGLRSGRGWTIDALRWSTSRAGERGLHLWSGLRERALSLLPRMTWGWKGVLERMSGRLAPELMRLAARERADLYIGHYPAGLSAAAMAAQRWKTRFAFDAEDLHSGEDTGEGQTHRAMLLERRYLGLCRYVSASSLPIAEELNRLYGIPLPIVLHNVFPWKDRERMDGKVRHRGREKVSLYWFSQTIGPRRGLEEALNALSRVKGSFALHLQGHCTLETIENLKERAREAGLEDRVFVHDPAAPEELLSRTAEHDIGLALEQPVSQSRHLCATNKIFMYALAGLAIAGTRTAGQSSVMAAMPGAALYPAGDPALLAAVIQRWVDDPAALAEAKAATLSQAKEKWNWESESRILLKRVAEVLA